MMDCKGSGSEWSVVSHACVQVGPRTRVPLFFADDQDKPFAERKRGVERHPLNARQHASVKQSYIQSVKLRGIVEGVRGEMWAVESPQGEAVRALSFGSLSEAFYEAIAGEPENMQLLNTARKGLEARLLSAKTPASVLSYLVHVRNRCLVSFILRFQFCRCSLKITMLFCSCCPRFPQWCLCFLPRVDPSSA